MSENAQLGEAVARMAQVVPNFMVWYVPDESDRQRCVHEDAEGRCERFAPWFMGVQWGEPDDDGNWWRYGDYCATHWMSEFIRWSDRVAPEQ